MAVGLGGYLRTIAAVRPGSEMNCFSTAARKVGTEGQLKHAWYNATVCSCERGARMDAAAMPFSSEVNGSESGKERDLWERDCSIELNCGVLHEGEMPEAGVAG